MPHGYFCNDVTSREAMEHVQISRTVFVPELTAELASRQPGVRKLLDDGFDVLHYMDRRRLDATSAHLIPEPELVPEPEPELTLNEKWQIVREKIEQQRNERLQSEGAI